MKKAFTIGLATALTVLSAATPAVARDQPSGDGFDGSGWSRPSCETVAGDGSMTYGWNDGKKIAPTTKPIRPVVYTTGLVALDRPNQLLAMSNRQLQASNDAGCTWTVVDEVKGSYIELVAARGGKAYAWDRDGNLSLATPEGATPLTGPGGDLIGLGVDRGNGDRLRTSDLEGQLHESQDGGRTWQPVGVPAWTPSKTRMSYTAVFDPRDLDHVVLGASDIGARVTFDGGRTWTSAAGLTDNGDKVSVFTAAVSPAAGNVVWAMGLNLTELDAGVPSGGRHIYRSDDGGRKFTPVVDQDQAITIPNGPLLAPHPKNSDVLYFDFGTGWSGIGTDIYKYDFRKNRVIINHNPYDRVPSIAFNPAHPNVMYLGVAEEV
ncbi:sialidase family protein [Nonomuraea spiralis]|uniref:WD40/YVTN/BNR-like repeat-containing protein n=1 Tax=Nonomuraea TaxID=83681 RepID=UPI000F795260|nr:sialidase family protein [Nonomuraea sp. WAC 01424]RSM98729.1 dispase autolysis-inducing protein [Nonomuraea sp. WAC 01424]